MDKKIKILAGFVINGKGGVDNYLLNFLDAVYGENIQVDFLANVEDVELRKKVEKYHSRIFCVARLWEPLKQYRQSRELIQREQYDIVYLNISTAIQCVTALAAKRCHVTRRILHSHSSGNNLESALKRNIYDIIHKICKLFLYRTANEYYACSMKAAEWLYPKKVVNSGKVHLIYNAVNRNKFRFNQQLRETLRQEMKLEDSFVLGHVGSFCYQKNQEFLIRIFERIQEKDKSAVLLLIGEGVQYDNIQKKVEELGLTKSIKFLGWRNDVADLMQAMDVFVLPSNFEGLPTVGIEAQCTGLPCVFSENITSETAITDRCKFLSLKESTEVWAEEILEMKKYRERGKVIFQNNADNYNKEVQRRALRKIIYEENEQSIDCNNSII